MLGDDSGNSLSCQGQRDEAKDLSSYAIENKQVIFMHVKYFAHQAYGLSGIFVILIHLLLCETLLYSAE